MIPGNHKIKVWDSLMKESRNLHSLMTRKKEMILQRRGVIKNYFDRERRLLCNPKGQ